MQGERLGAQGSTGKSATEGWKSYTPTVVEPPGEDGADDALDSQKRLAWEAPETAAVVVVVAVGVLAVGGLVAGIAASTASYGSFSPSHLATGTAIAFGAQWAGPLLAFVLLGVVGLCWWQSTAWTDASEPDDEQDRVSEVTGHIRRAGQISRWTQGALLLTCVGAIALVVGSVLQTTGAGTTGSLNWARNVSQVASLLAVLVVAGAGIWIARQIDSGQASSD
jgi:hypothetical protein